MFGEDFFSAELKARNKVLSVINSCETCDHLKSCWNLLDLFFKNFNNKKTYEELSRLLENKKIELDCLFY